MIMFPIAEGLANCHKVRIGSQIAWIFVKDG